MADFDIGDVADLLGIRRLGQGDNFDVVCPYCGDTRGKMNFLHSQKRQGGKPLSLFSLWSRRKYAYAVCGYEGDTGTDRWNAPAGRSEKS